MTDASNTIPCVRCGSPVPRSAQFCLACGTPVSARTQAVALGTPGAPGQEAAGGSVSDAGRPGPAAGAGLGVGALSAPQSADSGSWRPTPVAEPMLASQVRAAHYGRRVGAFLIDGAIGLAVWLIALLPLLALGAIRLDAEGTFSASGWSAVAVFLVALVYPIVLWFLQAFLGLTPGKAAVGLRIVRKATLARAGLGRILLRGLVVFAGSLVFGIGQLVVYLSPLWDSHRIGQGWHDKAADTWVIDVRRGPNPLKAGPGQLVFDVAPGSGGVLAPAAAPSPAPTAAAAPAPVPAPAPTVASAFPGFTDPPPVISAFAVRAEPVIESIPGFEPPPVAPVTEPGPDFEPGPAFQPVDAAPAASRSAAASDHDDDGESDLDSTRLSDSARTAAVPAAVPGAVSFRLDSGEVIAITGRGVLGRDPVPPSSSSIVIRMPGDTLSISKTHLEFGIDGGAPWVSDRGSTNGSALRRADGTTLPLAPGERVAVASGDRVTVGTRGFQVTVAAATGTESP